MKVNEQLWELLLLQKNHDLNDTCLGWGYDGTSISEINDRNSEKISSYIALLLKSDCANIEQLTKTFTQKIIPYNHVLFFVDPKIKTEDLNTLQNYWPLSVLNQLLPNVDLPYVFIHSATTLDGYLATESGDSKWIGNEDNLIHAHRLRALFNAVLVGNNTVTNDNPSLTVRHVSGKNPIRLVLSNNCANLSALGESCKNDTILLRHADFKDQTNSDHFNKVIFFEGNTKENTIKNLLSKCKNEGVNSILVEGGGLTISNFIETGNVDTIQFHISPILFGSGIKAVKLPHINSVEEALRLKNMLVSSVGNSFMITANLK